MFQFIMPWLFARRIESLQPQEGGLYGTNNMISYIKSACLPSLDKLINCYPAELHTPQSIKSTIHMVLRKRVEDVKSRICSSILLDLLKFKVFGPNMSQEAVFLLGNTD